MFSFNLEWIVSDKTMATAGVPLYQESLERAVIHLNQALQSDSAYLDLSDLLQVQKYGE